MRKTRINVKRALSDKITEVFLIRSWNDISNLLVDLFEMIRATRYFKFISKMDFQILISLRIPIFLNANLALIKNMFLNRINIFEKLSGYKKIKLVLSGYFKISNNLSGLSITDLPISYI